MYTYMHTTCHSANLYRGEKRLRTSCHCLSTIWYFDNSFLWRCSAHLLTSLVQHFQALVAGIVVTLCMVVTQCSQGGAILVALQILKRVDTVPATPRGKGPPLPKQT